MGLVQNNEELSAALRSTVCSIRLKMISNIGYTELLSLDNAALNIKVTKALELTNIH